MRIRTSARFHETADALIKEHRLDVTSTVVIASWFNPVPMVMHRTARLTESGDVTLSIVLVAITKLYALGFFANAAIALTCSLLISWFIFRIYYDFRFRAFERMILLPPTADNDTLLHELLHIHQGHIKRMSAASRILAVSPAGPFEFGIRALRHDYGARGWSANSTPA